VICLAERGERVPFFVGQVRDIRDGVAHVHLFRASRPLGEYRPEHHAASTTAWLDNWEIPDSVFDHFPDLIEGRLPDSTLERLKQHFGSAAFAKW